ARVPRLRAERYGLPRARCGELPEGGDRRRERGARGARAVLERTRVPCADAPPAARIRRDRDQQEQALPRAPRDGIRAETPHPEPGRAARTSRARARRRAGLAARLL